MALLTLGLNHTTAPVELREQVAFDAQRLPDALAEVQCSDEGSNPLHPQCSVLRKFQLCNHMCAEIALDLAVVSCVDPGHRCPTTIPNATPHFTGPPGCGR